MICKEYHQGINVTAPMGYFENWFSDMWRRRIVQHIVEPTKLSNIVVEEFKEIGATVEFVGRRKYKITFWDDIDYTAFVLRWSE